MNENGQIELLYLYLAIPPIVNLFHAAFVSGIKNGLERLAIWVISTTIMELLILSIYGIVIALKGK